MCHSWPHFWRRKKRERRILIYCQFPPFISRIVSLSLSPLNFQLRFFLLGRKRFIDILSIRNYGKGERGSTRDGTRVEDRRRRRLEGASAGAKRGERDISSWKKEAIMDGKGRAFWLPLCTMGEMCGIFIFKIFPVVFSILWQKRSDLLTFYFDISWLKTILERIPGRSQKIPMQRNIIPHRFSPGWSFTHTAPPFSLPFFWGEDNC